METWKPDGVVRGKETVHMTVMEACKVVYDINRDGKQTVIVPNPANASQSFVTERHDVFHTYGHGKIVPESNFLGWPEWMCPGGDGK